MNISQELAYYISEALQFYGIQDIVISPGSRNAPLVNQFIRSQKFNCSSCTDERSAGFKALGIALATNKPVALTCTSGTALLNYAPAICEAYYQGVPIVVISADRPSEWIDQGDGQTIRQINALGSYVAKSIQLNPAKTEDARWLIKRSLGEVFCCPEFAEQKRPIHINCSFEEPLYGDGNRDEKIRFREVLNPHSIDETKLAELTNNLNNASKVLWIVGQLDEQSGKEVSTYLSKVKSFAQHLIISETTSNLISACDSPCIDRSIVGIEDNFEEFQPEYLIHLGGAIVSKKIKHLLRSNKDKYTIRIHNTGYDEDTFKGLNLGLNGQVSKTLSGITEKLQDNPKSEYRKLWTRQIASSVELHHKYLNSAPYSDFKVFELLSKNLPENYKVFWGNSSVIRYAQLFTYQASNKHLANRGTSGIEGLNSTANGYASSCSDPLLLVTGDVSFFYDINGLENATENLKILLINNGGGNIFRIINGPDSMEQFETFLETHHNKNAALLSKHFGFEYMDCDKQENLESCLTNFFKSSNKTVLEVFTPRLDNPEILKAYFRSLKQQ